MECCGRPNRSDLHLSMEEEVKIEEKTRDYFDEKAPKRHTKPQRSEYSSQYADNMAIDDHYNDIIPELVEFHRLENDLQKLEYSRSEVTEEFMETEYYKDLNCIDKQHHTTGTGFIHIENAKGQCFRLETESTIDHHTSCRGNPGTNDWIPAADDIVSFSSGKPSRSEN